MKRLYTQHRRSGGSVGYPRLVPDFVDTLAQLEDSRQRYGNTSQHEDAAEQGQGNCEHQPPGCERNTFSDAPRSSLTPVGSVERVGLRQEFIRLGFGDVLPRI